MNRRLIILTTIALIGAILRFFHLGIVPNGVNSDEASAGVEALSILQSNKDIWGNRFPIYFPAWGSGLNPLYTYLSIPIIAEFGLNSFSARLLNAVVGSTVIPLVYLAAAPMATRGVGLLAAAFAAFAPWGIMASRWGLESNLLPFWMALGLLSLTRAVAPGATKRSKILAFVPWSVGFYAYSAAIGPLVVSGALIALVYRANIRKSPGSWISGVAIACLLCLPLALFHLRSILGVTDPSPTWLGFSMPALAANRAQQLYASPGTTLLQNLTFLLDGLRDPWISNQSFFFPPLTTAAPLLAAIGAAFVWSRRVTNGPAIILLPILAAMVIFLPFVPLNVNRFNWSFVPAVIFMAIGTSGLISEIQSTDLRKAVSGILCLLGVTTTVLFIDYYFKNYNDEALKVDSKLGNGFRMGLPTALDNARQLARPDDVIFLDLGTDQPYLWPLFYGIESIASFQATRKMDIVDGVYHVHSFGHLAFDAIGIGKRPFVFVVLKGREPCPFASDLSTNAIWSIGRCPGRDGD